MKKLIPIIITALMLTSCVSIPVQSETETSTLAKNGSVIIVETYEVESTDINANNFNVDNNKALELAFEKALSNNLIVENDGTRFICNNIVKINGCDFYSISAYKDNGSEEISNLFNVSVDVDNGNVYLNFDPTLDFDNNYKDIIGDIDDSDGRTRLIKIS